MVKGELAATIETIASQVSDLRSNDMIVEMGGPPSFYFLPQGEG